MIIQYLDPKTLIPYLKNPKRHPPEQIEVLKQGIVSFGFDQPIVVDQGLVIIKGHGRQIAAIELGLEVVPVIVRKVSENEARFLRVSDNHIPSSEWDPVALKEELKGLSTSGFDLALTGFDLPELDLIFSTLPTPKTSSLDIDPLVTSYLCPACGYSW